jgi:phage terminase large subunit GpA-like protein
MDQPGASSRESDKITQLEARTRAYGCRKRIYMECTVSTEQGRTWHEYHQGTRSRILLPCPHCGAWVMPERDHLVGWQGAETQVAPRHGGHFVCPSCEQAWTEDDRGQANGAAKLVHGDQSLDADGQVQGEVPASDSLGFRWSAVHNLFLTSGDFAADEWRASRATDQESAEREMRQFVWCLPVEATKWSRTPLEVLELANRLSSWPRGILPPDTQWLTAAVDVGKYLLHWVLVAWRQGATGALVDYGRIEGASSDLGVEAAVMVALRQFRDMALAGWPRADQKKAPIRSGSMRVT